MNQAGMRQFPFFSPGEMLLRIPSRPEGPKGISVARLALATENTH